jgi:hypothetical protein
MIRAPHPDADPTHFTTLANTFSAGYGDRLDGLAASKTRRDEHAGAYAAGYAAASVDLEIFGKPNFGAAFAAWLSVYTDATDRDEAPAISTPASRTRAIAALSIGDSITIPKAAYNRREILAVEIDTDHRHICTPAASGMQIKRWA